ncbi:MAG: RDD family protein [Aquihabitans sp.]
MTSYGQSYGDPTDVVGRRIGAYIIDALLMGAVIAAVLIPLFLSTSVEAPSGTVRCGSSTNSSFNNGFNEGFNGGIDNNFNNNAIDRRLNTISGPAICFDGGTTVRYIPTEDEGGFIAKVYGFAFGIQALNLVVLQGLTGASLGKLAVGLRVVRSDGKRAGFGWAFLRWVFLFIDSACCFLPGAILVFTTKGHRRLGDMVAGTYVVSRSSLNTALQVPGSTTASYGGGYQGGGYQGIDYQGVDPNAGTPGAWPAPGSPGQPATGGWGSPPPTAAASDDGPTWDSARNAYIQFDRDRGAWLQWDDNLKVWGPINQ